ncbi:MAG: 2Fe-2S iron-sulfur cluster-binding protein [Thermodesulfovibrionales bacterium]
MTSIIIDGREIPVEPEKTVLETARFAGIAIPTLCYHHALGPYGTCRLCIVEAEGPSLRHTITTSCNLMPADGLIVETATLRIQAMRRTILELMLSGTKPSPELRSRAAEAGIHKKKFSLKSRNSSINGINTDPCILCGLCVRVCRDTIRANALDFSVSGTNQHKVAEAVVLMKERCIGCGTCAAVCPVGALRLDDRGAVRRIILYGRTANRLPLVRCDLCNRPFTTEQFILSVLMRLSRDDDTLRTGIGYVCPDCGRNRFATALTGQFPPAPNQIIYQDIHENNSGGTGTLR